MVCVNHSQKLHHRASAAPVHSVDNSSESDVSTRCAPVRNVCVRAVDEEFLRCRARQQMGEWLPP